MSSERLGFEGARLRTWVFWRPGVKWNPQCETTLGEGETNPNSEDDEASESSYAVEWLRRSVSRDPAISSPAILLCQFPIIPQFPSFTPVLFARVLYFITASHCCGRLFLDILTHYDKRGGR